MATHLTPVGGKRISAKDTGMGWGLSLAWILALVIITVGLIYLWAFWRPPVNTAPGAPRTGQPAQAEPETLPSEN